MNFLANPKKRSYWLFLPKQMFNLRLTKPRFLTSNLQRI